MKTLTVEELTQDFPAALESVKRGESVEITTEKQGQPVALLMPAHPVATARPLGLYAGRIKVVFHDDWEMTDAELLRA